MGTVGMLEQEFEQTLGFVLSGCRMRLKEREVVQKICINIFILMTIVTLHVGVECGPHMATQDNMFSCLCGTQWVSLLLFHKNKPAKD